MSAAGERCPSCGAALRLTADRCWLCGVDTSDRTGRVEASAEEVVDATLVAHETAATFSLTSLFMVMTLAAVAAGVFAAAPGLGLLFLVIALPALVRTMVVTSRRKVRGEESTPRERVVAFFESAGVVLLILIAVNASLSFALFIACSGGIIGGMLTGFRSDTSMFIGAAIGGLLALSATGWTAYTIRQQRKKRSAARSRGRQP